ncbi:MAG: glycosyltransferase family 87 protein, partial [Chloroflexota bacterium]
VATAFAFPFALFLIMPRNPSPIILGTLMLLIPIFPPFNYHYALAQVSVYTMLLLILACISLEREKYILVGILFGLASGKPQLILLPVLGFAIALWRMGGWQAWLKVIIAGALIGILSLVPLFIADPNWLTDFFATVDNIPEWQRPSYLDLFVINFGSIGNYMFAVLCTVIIAINTWIWFKLPLRLAFLWCMTLNLVAIPLVWSWDFVMLLPLYVYYLLDLKSVVARILLIILFSVCIIASIGVNTFLGEAYYHWWIPTFMILSILIAIGVERYFSPKPETHSEARNEQSTLVRNLLSKSN